MSHEYDERLSYQVLKARSGCIRGFPTPEGWFLGRVIVPELVPYEITPARWETITGSSPALAVTGSAGCGFVHTKLLDASGNKIVYHENVNEIWEVFIGYSYPHDRIYQQYNGKQGGRLQKDIGDYTLSTSAAGTFGWKLKGWESPLSAETGRGRFLLPAFQEVAFGLFNESGRAHSPWMRFLFNKCVIEPFNPERKDHLKIIVGVLRGTIRDGVWLYSPSVDGLPLQVKSIKHLFEVEPVQWDGVNVKVGGVVQEAGGD